MTWIKLYESFLKWEWFEKAEMVQLFIYCLLSANSEDKKWQGKTIKRGSFITSISRIAAETHLTIKQTRTCLQRLEETGEIARKTTNQNTTITICKYDSYQATPTTKGQTKGKQKANEGQTKGKQRATTKEYKNIYSTTTSTAPAHTCEGVSERAESQAPLSSPPLQAEEKEKSSAQKEKELYALLAEQEEWLNVICMRHHLQPQSIPDLLNEFNLFCKAQAHKGHRDLQDLQSHFDYWIQNKAYYNNKQKQLSNGNNSTSNSPSAARQQRDEEFAEHIAHKIAGY